MPEASRYHLFFLLLEVFSYFRLDGCKSWGSCGSVCISWKQLAFWWHHGGNHWGLLVQADLALCPCDVLGCAGTQQLLAHQPPWSCLLRHWLHTHPSVCSVLLCLTFLENLFHGVPCRGWPQGRASSQGKLCWKTSLTSASRVGTLAFLPFTTSVKWWYLTLGWWEQTLPWGCFPQSGSGHQDPLCGQPGVQPSRRLLLQMSPEMRITARKYKESFGMNVAYSWVFCLLGRSVNPTGLCHALKLLPAKLWWSLVHPMKTCGFSEKSK